MAFKAQFVSLPPYSGVPRSWQPGRNPMPEHLPLIGLANHADLGKAEAQWIQRLGKAGFMAHRSAAHWVRGDWVRTLIGLIVMSGLIAQKVGVGGRQGWKRRLVSSPQPASCPTKGFVYSSLGGQSVSVHGHCSGNPQCYQCGGVRERAWAWGLGKAGLAPHLPPLP